MISLDKPTRVLRHNLKETGDPFLGFVPSSWDVVKLKRVTRFQYGDSLPAETRTDGDVPVYGSNGSVGQHSQSNTLAPCIIIGRKGSFGKVQYSEKPCFAIDTTYYIDRRYCAHNLRWLYYCLSALRLDGYTKDSAIPGLDREEAYLRQVALPPPAEQDAIVAFLDEKLADIDRYIAAKQRLIELLDEQKAAIINQAVTQGLDPAVEMKESGVEWLGEIPAHWEVLPLKHCIKPNTSISYGIVQPGDHIESGIPFLQTSDITSDKLRTRGLQRTMPEIAGSYPRSRLEENDVILGIRASIGAAHRVPKQLTGANLSRGIARIVPGKNIKAGFLVEFLRSQSTFEYWQVSKQGTTFNEVSISTVKELPVVLPSKQEQFEIVEFIRQKVASLSDITAKTNREIELMQELRTALIAEAVTGKIDVRKQG